MRSNLSPYWAWKNRDARDIQVFAEMQPRMVLILDPDRSLTQSAYDVCRDSLFALRDYPRSLPTPDKADPVAVGRATAEFWARRVDEIANFIPRQQVLVLDENEPDVNPGGAGLARHLAREVAFLDRCTELALRAAAGRYSVGWPHNVAAATRTNWPAHKPVIDAIRRGQAKGIPHAMSLHEYGGLTSFGARPEWFGWKLGRFWHLADLCPDIDIMIGEFGFDLYTDDGQKIRPQVRGWQGNIDWDAYFAGAKWYDAQTQYCPQVLGVLWYLYDYANEEWGGFNWRAKREEVLNYMRDMREGRVALLPKMPQPKYTADNYAAVLKAGTSTPSIPNSGTAAADAVWDALNAAFGTKATDLRGKLATNGGYAKRSFGAIQRIVVHHSTGQPTVTWEGIASYHVGHNKWPGIGYHIGIRQDGSVAYLGDIGETRYHAGNANGNSVGICFAGDYRTVEPSQVSREAFAKVRAVLEQVLGRKLAVVGHRDVGDTVCPGDRLYAAVVKADPVRAALEAEADKHDLTLVNPDFALHKAITAAGLQVVGDEFSVSVDGVNYVARVGRKPGGGKRQIFYCEDGRWDAVRPLN